MWSPHLTYEESESVTRIHKDVDSFTLVMGEKKVNLEDVIEEWIRLKAEQKKAEELVEEYIEEEIMQTLTDAPLDDPTHHSWDRYLKLANHESS